MITMDSAMNNDFLMISKSLVPYLDADKQRAAAIFIKAFELMSTIDLFSKEDFRRTITKPRDTGWEKKLLSDIRSNLSDDRAFFIDAILKLSEVRDILTVKNTDSSYANFAHTPPVSSAMPANPSEKTADPISSAGSTNSAPKAAEVIDQLSGVLDPNQLQILKLISTFMK